MKDRLFRKIIIICLTLIFGTQIGFPAIPKTQAASVAQRASFDLSGQLSNAASRRYVQMMLDYHVRNNAKVRKTLEEGGSAVFLFDGCSDHMDDPELSDLTYYRVSAVCVVLRLDEAGVPKVVYFNEECSTLPDRPLDYGAWELDGTKVGPATVHDGTYELYSVRHSGVYEALHVRTSYWNETVNAVYLAPEGFVSHLATEINIHTRTGNHILQRSMWSAGCMLVGGGIWSDFTDLMESTYYSSYENFASDRKVGCLTVDRQFLKEELPKLYQNEAAVTELLKESAKLDPAIYMEGCGQPQLYSEARRVRVLEDLPLMTLPCDNAADARSVPITSVEEGDKLQVDAVLENPQGERWLRVMFIGNPCYIPENMAEDAPITFLERLMDFFLS